MEIARPLINIIRLGNISNTAYGSYQYLRMPSVSILVLRQHIFIIDHIHSIASQPERPTRGIIETLVPGEPIRTTGDPGMPMKSRNHHKYRLVAFVYSFEDMYSSRIRAFRRVAVTLLCVRYRYSSESY